MKRRHEFEYTIDGIRAASQSFTTDNKHEPLTLHPHYSNRHFDKPRTVFGPESESSSGHDGLNYNYSDRLQQWDYSKHSAAWERANKSNATKDSAAFLEVYLSAYHGKPVEVVHVIAGVNLSSGYPWWCAGWRDAAADVASK